MQVVSTNAKSPYKFTAIIEEGSESAEVVQAVPIPARETVQAVPVIANPNGVQRGMKCAWGRHVVRVEAIDLDEGLAEVYPLGHPDLSGPAKLSSLLPIPVAVNLNDKVLLWAGEGRPVTSVVVETHGDTALFFSPVYQDSLWLHTSLIVSVCPRSTRR